MARRDLGLLLGDVLDGCEALTRYLQGVSLSRYVDDEILRMAVERRLEIVGEALSQALARTLPSSASSYWCRSCRVGEGQS